MKNLTDVTHEDFLPCLHEVFSVKVEDEIGPELELIEVKTIGEISPNKKDRLPFSLLFRGPSEPILPQQMYPLKNSEFGEILLFIVPIGPDEDGMLYDASFN